MSDRGRFSTNSSLWPESTFLKGSVLEHDRFFSLSLDMLAIAGPDGYFKDVNPAWELTLGWKVEELLERPFVDFVHPDDKLATLNEASKLESGMDSIGFENRYGCKDGSYKWLAWRATKSTEDGLIYAIARDVSQSRRAEQQRVLLLDRERRLTAQLRLLLESTHEGIYGIDLNGRCTFVNRSATAMLGYTESQLHGKDMHSLIHHTRPDGSSYPFEECPIAGVFRRGRGGRVNDEFFWRADGTPFPVEYSWHPIVEAEIVSGAVVTFFDTTERVEAARR